MFVKSAVKLVAKLQLKLPLKKAHNYLYSVSVMYVCMKYISLSIGYFRVSPGLSIKMRFCTAFDMEMVVILMRIKVISIRKVVPTALGLIWKVRVFVTSRKWHIHVIHDSALG